MSGDSDSSKNQTKLSWCMCISIYNHISFTRKSFSLYRHQGGNVWNRNAEVMDKVDLSQTGIHNAAHHGGKEVSLRVLVSLGGGSKGKRQRELHSVVSASHISHKCCGSASIRRTTATESAQRSCVTWGRLETLAAKSRGSKPFL